jgi:two-component system, NarL family, invasion response regulator UvrY
MPDKQKMRLALVDDHTLFRKGMINLIEMVCSDCEILFEADNGLDLQQKLKKGNEPDIILMDVNMPHMDGFAAVQWLNANFPKIKILVISMVEKEESIVRMIKLGVKGYLNKDVEPRDLGDALNAIMAKGFYYTDYVTGKLVHSLQNENAITKLRADAIDSMSDREKEFLKLACSDLTYNDIAVQMFLSPKTIDGYRTALFDKLHVKSRVGMALFAVKYGLVEL